MVYSPWSLKELNMTELIMEKAMATHSSILAWRIPWVEKPGELRSIGLHRVRQT